MSVLTTGAGFEAGAWKAFPTWLVYDGQVGFALSCGCLRETSDDFAPEEFVILFSAEN